MFDYRRETVGRRVFRFVWFSLATLACLVFLGEAAASFGDPASAIRRYRGPAAAPHVFVRGTLRKEAGSALRALCTVEHERYQSCGKSRCWKWAEGMISSHAELDVEWSSSPLPKSMTLAASFQLEPKPPPYQVLDPAEARARKAAAQKAGLGFSFADSTNDRIVEECLDDGERVFIEACVSPTNPTELEPCAGLTRYGVIPGEPQSAIDYAADRIAMNVSAAFLALLVGLVGLVRPRSRIAEGLEDRGAPHQRTLGWGWALLAILPVAGFGNLLLHGAQPPSTWATGRDGFAFGIATLSLWILFAFARLLHRTRTLAALGPVLATPRSLLARAEGTVELAVRARLRGEGVRALIGDDTVAASETRIVEVSGSGKSTQRTELLIHRQTRELDVVDESGDGVIQLDRAILDTELRKVTMPELSPRYQQHGIVVERHAQHRTYEIEERVVRDGEQLYVFGEVSGIQLAASEVGYRSVRGAPTLGGDVAAPVLIYGGDERGLVASLTTEARSARSMAVVAACASVALASVLGYLASL